MAILQRQDASPTGTTAHISSFIVKATRTISTAATISVTPTPTPPPHDTAADRSLWAEFYNSGKAGKLAAGIDALLGLLLVVFFAVIVYQWRKRSGAQREVVTEGAVGEGVGEGRRGADVVKEPLKGRAGSGSSGTVSSPCSERSGDGDGNRTGGEDEGRKTVEVVIGGK